MILIPVRRPQMWERRAHPKHLWSFELKENMEGVKEEKESFDPATKIETEGKGIPSIN